MAAAAPAPAMSASRLVIGMPSSPVMGSKADLYTIRQHCSSIAAQICLSASLSGQLHARPRRKAPDENKPEHERCACTEHRAAPVMAFAGVCGR
jgi:hypothetical protein